jgi:hypothetical protein
MSAAALSWLGLAGLGKRLADTTSIPGAYSERVIGMWSASNAMHGMCDATMTAHPETSQLPQAGGKST